MGGDSSSLKEWQPGEGMVMGGGGGRCGGKKATDVVVSLFATFSFHLMQSMQVECAKNNDNI